jgi:SNF2 family DNA or RNA helicase
VSTLTLREYQQTGAAFLRTKRRAMLIDAPGLGKTVQALHAAEPPILVVAPAYLTRQWFEFLCEEFDGTPHTVTLATGNPRNKQAALENPTTVTVINTEMLRRPPNKVDARGRLRATYTLPHARTVIFDESHHLRGHTSQQHKGALALALRTERVYLLTATPILKSPDDLFAQLRLIDPDKFPSYWRFVEQYCFTMETNWALKVLGWRRKSDLDGLLAEYALGRTYKDVQLQLPPLIEKVIPIEPSSTFKRQYQETRKNYTYNGRDLLSLSEMMHTLRKACNTEKMVHLLQTLADNPHGGTAIFCWYQETAEQLAELLMCPIITGAVEPRERALLARTSDFLVVTMAALSEGVDLSHLRNVIFFETDYLPGRMTQALARVQRWRPVGDSSDPITVTYPVLRRTIDEIVYEVARNRGATIQQIMYRALQQ